MERVRRSKIVNVDETSEKVDGVNHWLWVFTTQTDTFFAIRKSRGKKVLDEVSGEDFEGYLGCDGWRSYSNFTDRLQRCWAQLLREAEWLAEHCEEAKPLYLALKGVYGDLVACLVGDLPLSQRKKLRLAAKRRLRIGWKRIMRVWRLSGSLGRCVRGLIIGLRLLLCLVLNRRIIGLSERSKSRLCSARLLGRLGTGKVPEYTRL